MESEIRLQVPPEPEVLIRLNKEVAKDSPSVDEITNILESDVGLVGSMLGLANSSMFGGNGRYRSIKQAVIFLGMKTINAFATTIMIKKALGGDSKNLKFFWAKSNAVAAECEEIANTDAFSKFKLERGESYTACLLRDCGQAILVMNFANYEEQVGPLKIGLCNNLAEIERSLFGIDHAKVGSMVCRYWGMSSEVCDAIRDHGSGDSFVKGQTRSEIEKVALMSLGHLGHVRYLAKNGIYKRDEDYIVDKIVLALGLSKEEINTLTETEVF